MTKLTFHAIIKIQRNESEEIKMLMARTNEKSYLNNYNGEAWQVVELVEKRYPSGICKCVKFADGFIVKIERCEIDFF